MKRLDVEFLVSDESVNCYGYRLLSSGFEADRYRPRIGYLMHRREDGVAVRWEELKVEGDEIYAVPVINDRRFPDLLQEIEEGFYVGASVGGIVALEWSDDPELKLAGQTGPTVTRWYCREISIVDVPGNYHALAKLYDADGNILMDLSGEIIKPLNREIMSKLELDSVALGMLNLSAEATQEQLMTALQDLVNRAKSNNDLEQRYEALVALRNAERVEAIITQALADRKMYPAMAEHLKKHYAGDPDSLEMLVSTMPQQAGVQEVIDGSVPAELAGKSYQELFLSGELSMVREKYPSYYKKLEKEQVDKYGRIGQ